MIVVELIYKKPLAELERFVEAHRAFLQKYYDEGILIVSGPKNPRTGGIIIGLVDEAKMREIVTGDPFYQHEIADYRYISFEPVKYCNALRPLIET